MRTESNTKSQIVEHLTRPTPLELLLNLME
jgi:hypothetical protein